jgi:CRP-like cAMP-binding protein
MSDALGKTFQPGDDIVRQGDVGDCMYVIQQGDAEVLKEVDGEQIRVDIMKTGDIFGEIAIVEHTTRSSTVRAITEVHVMTIDRKTFLRRVQEDPSLALNVLKVMAHRVRGLDQELAVLKKSLPGAGPRTG